MYSGLNTIGGVNASVCYGKDRVIFEFGSAYQPATDVFDARVRPRKKNWIRDMLRIGILPRIDGVFRREDLAGEALVSAEESDWNTAVFITHLHLDHMAFIGTVAPEIPVYMHHNAVTIERALEATQKGVPSLERSYRDIVPNEPISVGDIEVLPILCRDTSYCDFAFLITTPDGTIHWTGDLCLHGLQADKTLRQMEILKQRGVDVMLCDCTSFMDSVLSRMIPDCDPQKILPSADLPEGMFSEEDYYAYLFAQIKDLKGLCVFNYYQREMDDAARFLAWAEALGRICVFEPDAAYIIYRFFGIEPHVYFPDTAACQNGEASPWMRELLAHCTLVQIEEICDDPSKYMVQNSYENVLELFSLPDKDGVYLHADGIPIGAFDPAYANLRKIIAMTGFSYVSCFCEKYFGHGYPQQVKFFVDSVNPNVLIPCHSYNPERLLPKDGVQLLPEMYCAYTLENHVFYRSNGLETK